MFFSRKQFSILMTIIPTLFIGVLSGCGGESVQERSSSLQPIPEIDSDKSATSVLATVHVEDLQGNPLPNMAPIATLQPNAFDAPCATGPLTDGEGDSHIALSSSQWLYVRAWDPGTRYFANNYFDVPPGDAPIDSKLTIVMAQGASLQAQFIGAGGQPVANEVVGLMMSHPDKGPWWPSEATTNADGTIIFRNVPPGRFLLQFKAAESGTTELPEIALEPGGLFDLGRVLLN